MTPRKQGKTSRWILCSNWLCPGWRSPLSQSQWPGGTALSRARPGPSAQPESGAGLTGGRLRRCFQKRDGGHRTQLPGTGPALRVLRPSTEAECCSRCIARPSPLLQRPSPWGGVGGAFCVCSEHIPGSAMAHLSSSTWGSTTHPTPGPDSTPPARRPCSRPLRAAASSN